MLFDKNNVQVMFCALFLIFQTIRFLGKVHEDYNTLMITLLENLFPLENAKWNTIIATGIVLTGLINYCFYADPLSKPPKILDGLV